MNSFQEQLESDVFYGAIKPNGYFYDFDPQQKSFLSCSFFFHPHELIMRLSVVET